MATPPVLAEDPLTLPLVQVQMRLLVGPWPAAPNGRILTNKGASELVGRYQKPYHTVMTFTPAMMRADLGGGISSILEHPESASKVAAVPPGLTDDEDERARLKILPAFEKDDYRFTGVMLRISPVMEGPKLRVKVNGGIGYIRGMPLEQLSGREKIHSDKGGWLTNLRELPWDGVTKHLGEASGLLGTVESICLDLGELEPGKAATLVVTVLAFGREGLRKKDFAYRAVPLPPSQSMPLLATGELIELEPDDQKVLRSVGLWHGYENPDYLGPCLPETYEKIKAGLKDRWTHLPATRFETGKDTVALWPALPDVRLSTKVFRLPPKNAAIAATIDELNFRFVGNPGYIRSVASLYTRYPQMFVLPAAAGQKPRLLFITLNLPPEQ